MLDEYCANSLEVNGGWYLLEVRLGYKNCRFIIHKKKN